MRTHDGEPRSNQLGLQQANAFEGAAFEGIARAGLLYGRHWFGHYSEYVARPRFGAKHRRIGRSRYDTNDPGWARRAALSAIARSIQVLRRTMVQPPRNAAAVGSSGRPRASSRIDVWDRGQRLRLLARAIVGAGSARAAPSNDDRTTVAPSGQLGQGRPGKKGDRIVLQQTIDWLGGTQRILTEARRIEIADVSDPVAARVLSWQSRLTNDPGTATIDLWGTHYYGLGMRMSPAEGPAKFASANGATGEKIQGSERLLKGDWCSYSAKRGGQDLTLVFFDDPKNPRPATWFTMDSPFTYVSATVGLNEKPLRVAAGESVQFQLWSGRGGACVDSDRDWESEVGVVGGSGGFQITTRGGAAACAVRSWRTRAAPPSSSDRKDSYGSLVQQHSNDRG